jgi:spore germination protein GerM
MIKTCASILLILTFSIVSFPQKSGTMTIKLFYANQKPDKTDGCDGKVFPVTREIPKTGGVAKAALEELFKGPTKAEEAEGFWSYFREETKSILISVKVKKGAAYVNLKGEIVEKLGSATTSCGGKFHDASIEKTLTQFPNIKKVFFAIEGDPAAYYDWIQVGECPKELKNCSNKDF